MRKPKSAKDIETLAQEAKMKRQTDCSDEINKTLAQFNCQFIVTCQVGEQAVPLSQLLNLPTSLNVISKGVQ